MKIMTDKQFEEAIKKAVQRYRNEQYMYERIERLQSELRSSIKECQAVTEPMFYDLCNRVRKLEDLIEHINIPEDSINDKKEKTE